MIGSQQVQQQQPVEFQEK